MGEATIQKDVAPLFERPMLESQRLDEVLYGMNIQIIEQSNTGWCYARTEHGTQGYMLLEHINTSAEVALAWKKYKKSVVLASYIDIQQQPKAEAGCTISLPRGATVVALKAPDLGGWQKVGLANGVMGYTRASYLGEAIDDWNKLSEDDMRWNLVESALAYNGTSYREGGRSPLGIDAVGLVAMTYALNGVTIYREPFFKVGTALRPIDPKSAEEGDILYFKDSLGIFMGDGHFVHATQYKGSEGVVVSSLRPRDDDYRGDLAEHIVGAASLYAPNFRATLASLGKI